jgi:eukaryotic-like serine/threonine-protein kinase
MMPVNDVMNTGEKDPRIDQSAGQYRIDQKIGSGAMGDVYLGRHQVTGAQVALKFLHEKFLEDHEASARFRIEAHAATILKHPNICEILEFGVTSDEEKYICMQYYPGETLKQRILRDRPGLSEALQISIQIAQGLEAAHSRGIIHRDIKPSNIMLTENQVRILDFGLAKIIGEATITKLGSRMGTVEFMSPEQARGLRIDHRTDIWALGVLMYLLLTGRLPFPAGNPLNTLYSIVRDEPVPLRRMEPGISDEMAVIVEKALQKERDNRYSNVSDLLHDLELMQGEMPARPGSRLAVSIGLVAILMAALAVCLFLAKYW